MRSDDACAYLEHNCSNSVNLGRAHALKPSRAAGSGACAAHSTTPVNVYPVPPTSGVAGSAVPITIELAITVRTSAAGSRLVLAGVPDDVNLPANVIVHTPMYTKNDTPLYVATPEAALMGLAFPDSTHAAGATVVVTVMSSCAVTTLVPILNTTAATASVEGIASIRRTRSAAPNL